MTEVAKREVELFLDDDLLSLNGFSLSWEGDGGQGDSMSLDAYPNNMPAGTFLVVWEGSGYTGAPMFAPYTQGTLPSVPGIKVRAGFFDQIDNVSGVVYVHGTRGSTVKHKVRDTVKFGPAGHRPASGADTFTENGTLGNPSGSVSLQRKWNGAVPKDTNHESDWIKPLIGKNLGAPTPP